jgi:hypothetical protein
MTARFLLFVFFLIAINVGMPQNPKDSLCNNIIITKKDIQFILPSIPIYDSIVKEYTVNEIIKIDRAYIIEIEDIDGYVFAVISPKCKKQKGEKIRKGKKYNFLLYALYDPKIRRMQAYGHGLKEIVYVEKAILCIDYDIIGIRVTTPNLKGLYYIPVGSVPSCTYSK